MSSDELLPKYLHPVIAEITHQGSLGLEEWEEVIYYDEELEKWTGYEGGCKFDDGESVMQWRYTDGIFDPITLDQAKEVAAANNCAIVPLEVSEAIKPLLEYVMEEWPSAKVVIGELGEMVARIDGTYLLAAQEQSDDKRLTFKGSGKESTPVVRIDPLDDGNEGW